MKCVKYNILYSTVLSSFILHMAKVFKMYGKWTIFMSRFLCVYRNFKNACCGTKKIFYYIFKYKLRFCDFSVKKMKKG